MSEKEPRSNPFEPVRHEVNKVTGERIGAQRPTNLWVPEYATSIGDKAMRFLNLVGFELDEWQEFTLREMLGERPDGKFASKEVCILAPRQNGKLQRLDAPILTANRGWQTFATLRVGDEVFHPDGTAVRVAEVLPIDLGQECFRVTTTDGRSEIFGGEHLWRVTDKCSERAVQRDGVRTRWFEERTLTTREMFDTGTSRYRGGSRTSVTDGVAYKTNEYRYVLPRQHALSDLPKVELPIDPYLLGAWLGDGASAGAHLTTHIDDLPHWLNAVELAGFFPTSRRDQGNTWTVGITGGPGKGRYARALRGKLRTLGVLGNKHVPDLYLLASDMQREALLQGLMDTDGCCGRNGVVEFCSMNRGLAEAVLFLARSLGWRAVFNTGRATIQGRDCGEKYRVTWTPTLEDPYSCFQLPRKLANVKQVDGGRGRFTLSIKNIERVPTVPMRCIRVDREDGLYLAGRDLIPTHNTACIEARELVGLFLLGEELIYHTAHLFPTARESYYRTKAILRANPELWDMVHPRSGNDNLGFELKSTGARLLYKARNEDAGRGFSGDVIVLDEAYALTDEDLAAIRKTTSARRNPQIIYGSSTGKENSDALIKIRDRGLAHEPRLALFEWCADEGADLDDVEQWYKANPALGIRIDLETVEDERRGDAEKVFARERLGLWHDNKFRTVIDLDLWNSLKDPDSKIVSKYVLAVDATPSPPHDAAIALAGFNQDGKKQVEIVQTGRTISWVVETASRLYQAKRNPPPLAICVQGGTAAGRLIPELQQVKDADGNPAEVIIFGARDATDACGFFESSITDGSLIHLGDASVLTALSGATKIRVGKLDGPKGEEEYRAWYWGRKDTLIDISPLCAETYALWGLNMKTSEAELTKKHYEGKPFGGGLWLV